MDHDDEEDVGASLPPAADDRLWRHPTELPPSVPAVDAATNPWRIALISALAGAAASAAIVSLLNVWMDNDTPVRSIERVASEQPLVTTAKSKASAQKVAATTDDAMPDVVAIAERVRPALVQLLVRTSSGVTTGSGVTFRSDGHILTNSHVVKGATNIAVVMANGKQLAASIVGRDAETDLAVLKVQPQKDTTFSPATLGTAVNLKVGEPAIAIGSPLGLAGGPSVSVGVISALGRQVEADSGATSLFDMIQTDAPITNGSSGGALLDRHGWVIGITTAVGTSEQGGEGMGFAISIDIARHVAEQLITAGAAEHPWLGIIGEDVDATTAEQLAIDGGAVVKDVTDGSPAAAAGIKATDVVVSCNTYAVSSMAGLVTAIRHYEIGEKIHLGVMHNGEKHTVDITLESKPH